MKVTELRLPRLEGATAREPELLALLAARARPLWREARIHVPLFPLCAALESALQRAAQSGQLVRGLEGAARALAAEERGLRMADEASPEPRRPRVSRLLVLADDGAERFYRNAEVLLQRHEPRVLALRLAVDAGRLGESLFAAGEIARLVLLSRKEAVVSTLLALLDPAGPEPPGPSVA